VIDFASGAPGSGALEVTWIHGARGEPRIRFGDFIIYNEPRRGDQLKLMARGVAHRLRSRRS
jgi:hypothetical protein